MTSMENCVVGLDLGGTNIKAALIEAQGRIVDKFEHATEPDRGPEHVIHRMVQAAREVCRRTPYDFDQISGIGVGCPGPLDAQAGVIIKSANLPGWSNVPLRDRLGELSGKKTVILNDANAAAYGEYWQGAGRSATRMCLLTLGTGIGGGVVLHGELLQGAFGNGAELGHMILFAHGRLCRCGQRGCLEAYAGGFGLRQRALEAARTDNGKALQAVLERQGSIEIPDIVAAARNGEEPAAAMWAEACQAVGIACVNLIHVFEPQLILLGGGISAAGDALLDPVRSAVRAQIWHMASSHTQIELAALGNEAGVLGSAGWFLHLMDRDAGIEE